MQNVTPAQHLLDVQGSFAGCPDPRLREIMQSLVRHLHGFVADVGLTRDEWFAGIRFLTEVGHLCDDQRQEFILLSDTLGVSMLVEMVNQDGADGTTEPTVLGPFHVDGAPRRAMGDSIAIADDGQPLALEGVVRDLDGQPIAGAELDVWQTASNGFYDVQDPEQPPMNLRGIFTTGADGRFWFATVRPVAYSIPDDGPVGRMLAATGRHPMRPAHVHVVVSAPGFRPITTHLFDRASDYLDSDAVFGVRESLVVDLTRGDGGTLAATFDLVLDRA